MSDRYPTKLPPMPEFRKPPWWKWLIFWRIGLANIVAYVFIVVVFVIGQVQADNTTRALCVFRADIEERVVQSEDFLMKHPQGFAGIPASAIRVSLAGQQRTVDALASLDC